MIKSNYIKDIVFNLLDASDVPEYIKKQIPQITEEEIEYTGAGVFVSFTNQKNLNENYSDIEKLYDGLKIESPELEHGAIAQVFIKTGSINYLEIWSYSGNYPKHDLINYKLLREWEI